MDTKIAVLFQQNKFEDIIQDYEKRGNTINSIGRYFVAISYLFLENYEKAQKILSTLLKSAKDLPDFECYMALTYLKLGNYKKGKQFINKAASRSILYYETNIEISLKSGQLKRANRLINEATTIGIVSMPIEINRAIILLYQRKRDKAKAVFIQLLKKDSKNILIYDNLIRIFTATKEHSKNEVLILQYLNHDPNYLPYLWHLIGIYSAQGRRSDMKKTFQKIKGIDKEFAFFREVFTISSAYGTAAEIIEKRNETKQILTQALKSNFVPKRPDVEFRVTPFYYSYHQEENREIFEDLANIFQKGLLKVPPLTKRPKRKQPKIALISQHFYNQSVMDFYLNTLINIPKDFHVTVINIDPVFVDSVTNKLYQRADEVLQPSIAQSELIPLILNGQYDMIIYPEVGMSPCIYYLAMQRLAPIQTVIIGHPDTTGINTLDYYVSWKKFHTPSSHDQFTETLVTLDNIPICYDFPKELMASNKSRKSLGLPHNGEYIYAIPLILFKIHPSFDEVIEKIVKENKKNHVVMVCYNQIEIIIKERLEKRVSTEQMQQIHFKLPFKKSDYYALLKTSDVFLETFPFGGGNTVLHSMAAGTPVISLKSNQLRGSFGTGFYNYINEPQFIASSIDEYVKIAIKTARDASIKKKFQNIIQLNKEKLFNNMSGSIEFYDWLKQKLL